jgi:YidC/Oxa1 family membrane protein insertase
MLPLLATAVAKVAAAGSTTTSTVPLAAQTTDHSIFNPIAKPIADVLAAFYSVIPNFGVSILLLSVAWMIIIAPLTLKSTRSMLAMQKLQPQLKKLQAEHKNDRQAFAAAQMELFKEHNVSPFGSCLPTLLPLPVFFALFRVIDGLSHHVVVNGVSYADPNFLAHNTRMYHAIFNAHGHINAFGLDLSKNALSGHSSFAAALPYYVLLLIMIGTQYLQTAQMMSRNPAANDNPQMKMMKYLPIFFGVVCIRFPAGVILYYAMSNVMRMTQQTLMYRYDPKVKALVAQEVVEVEAMTRDIDRKAGGTRPGGGSAAGGPKGKKPPPDSPPARNSRFRDALAQASKQASEGKAKKAADQVGKAKPGEARPNARPNSTRAAAKGRPNGAVAKGAPDPSQPAKARARPAPNGTTNGAARAKPPANGTPAPKPAANGNGASTGAAKANGAPRAPAGNTNGAPRAPAGNGNGAPKAPAGNGNGAPGNASPGSDTGSSDRPPDGTKSPRTGAGAGRTGASQSRTPRKRRGR